MKRIEGHIKHFDESLEWKRESGLETLEFPEAVKRQLLKNIHQK